MEKWDFDRYKYFRFQKNNKELSKIEKKIWDYAGVEFNINSPKQISDIIFLINYLYPRKGN